MNNIAKLHQEADNTITSILTSESILRGQEDLKESLGNLLLDHEVMNQRIAETKQDVKMAKMSYINQLERLLTLTKESLL